MNGLLITHEGKRYFLRPEILDLCRVSDAELKEAQKHGTIPDAPITPLEARSELSEDQLGKAVGGVKTVRTDTIMCPW
jgi:hypothetical protein